ncbi:MAG: phosphate signaling complex protein PhoU [Acidobacteria bacterium]|jgi:phosphate transport system protein|nr:phosphate signaling complex protein PhoU [Acidobacteriota bacterium]
MTTHWQREIEKLKKQIFQLSDMVKQNLEDAVNAIEKRDIELARRVHESDDQIDQREIEIEENCLKILALYQPVAIDLRFIVAVLKINNDLERIGDEAVNISARAMFINSHPPVETKIDFSGITAGVKRMLTQSLDALMNLDAQTAYIVRGSDDEVDQAVHQTFVNIKEKIRAHPENVDVLIDYARICRYLERVADHATNIAEDVIYMVEGVIVRHKPEM